MKLLGGIILPNQDIIQYANSKSKNIWQTKIKKGSNLYPVLEYETVKHGVRKCMISHSVNPSDMHILSRKLLKDGLIIVPLAKEGNRGNGFGHMSQGYNGQGNYVYRSVIGRNINDINEFIHAHLNNDDRKIGSLLGYPECCSAFFDEKWRQGYIDPIWQQAENTPKPYLKNKREFTDNDGNVSKHLIRIKPSETDEEYKILSVFRYIGIRVISHLPCSFNCKASIDVANQWIDLAQQLKVPGLEEALEVLQLPFEWDCLKGVAIVNTPVFKIVTTSVPCYPRHVVQRESPFYPIEAPNGIQFPWKFNGTTCN